MRIPPLAKAANTAASSIGATSPAPSRVEGKSVIVVARLLAPLLQRADLPGELVLGGLLQSRVEPGPHPQAHGVRLGAEPIVQLAPHPRNEPRCARGLLRRGQVQLLAERLAQLV